MKLWNLESVSAFEIGRIGIALEEQSVERRRPDCRMSRVRLVDDVAVGALLLLAFPLAVVEEVVVSPEMERRSAVRSDGTTRNATSITNSGKYLVQLHMTKRKPHH